MYIPRISLKQKALKLLRLDFSLSEIHWSMHLFCRLNLHTMYGNSKKVCNERDCIWKERTLPLGKTLHYHFKQ